MAQFRISGVWVNTNKVVTHYAIHTVNTDSTSKGSKTSKAQAIALLEINGNSATTWMWNYKEAKWNIGEKVEVVNSPYGKYLRTDANNKLTDNLAHLIDYDWIAL